MITNFKMFENIKEPEIGDYVLIDYKLDMKETLDDMIGQIIEIDHNYLVSPYAIHFSNVLQYPNYVVRVGRNEILSFSKDKNQLEMELNAKKYNI